MSDIPRFLIGPPGMPEDGGEKLVKEIEMEDRKIVDEIINAHDQSERISHLYEKRMDLYKKAIWLLPLHILYRLYLSNMTPVIEAEMVSFQTRNSFEKQTMKIISRLDTIEKELKNMKERIDNK